MAIDILATFTNQNGVAFPDSEAINASGPSATDGTEFIKVMIDNYMFGPQQALLNYAGITPSGTPESDTASQELDAMKQNFGFPGEAVDWYGDADPATLGMRVLLLQGQGVLIASFPELTASVYVGDGNNPTAPAFFKADDAAGTIRNTAGVWLILPDAQDLYPRFVGETSFGARVVNNGAASLTSEGKAFIDNVSRSALGEVTVTYLTSFFSVTPAVVASPELAGVGGNVYSTVSGATAAKVDITTDSHDSTNVDANFTINVERQDTDYTIFPTDFIQGGIRY